MSRIQVAAGSLVVVPANHFTRLVLPLATSAATFSLALFQYAALLPFLNDEKLIGTPHSRWWTRFFKYSIGLIIVFPTTSATLGFLSWRALANIPNARQWYAYGSILAIGHFAFVPAVAGPIGRFRAAASKDGTPEITAEDEESREKWIAARNRSDLITWLSWHTIRTITVDLGAAICFGIGLYRCRPTLVKA